MPIQNKDRFLKRDVRQILENSLEGLNELRIDREVYVNFTGARDPQGNLLDDKEIDVMTTFRYGGKKVAFFVECEDSSEPSESIRQHYRAYNTDVNRILAEPADVQVTSSKERAIRTKDLRTVEVIRTAFAYGRYFSKTKLSTCRRESEQYSFAVWNRDAVTYFKRMSSTLRGAGKYELFREFSLDVRDEDTVDIDALEIKQKGVIMYLAALHPGRLLEIGYVLRRALPRTHAYQRMLSPERIGAISAFLNSRRPAAFIPNSVIVVFDRNPKIQRAIQYHPDRKKLTVPMGYCSAWIIDGQHRAYGFLGTKYEEWRAERREQFDLPVVVFKRMEDVLQTQTFININYNQKRIKTTLLCDLIASTGDLTHKLTWPSKLGLELNERDVSPLYEKVEISELHYARPISLASLVQFGLLETLLGYKRPSDSTALPAYRGPLYRYAPFDPSLTFDANASAFRKQAGLLVRFFEGVKENTKSDEEKKDPWRNTKDYALLKPTGINALFLVLGRILQRYPAGDKDLSDYLKPLGKVKFNSKYVAARGGGWKGFRNFANIMIGRLNKGKKPSDKLLRYGKKGKV
jgi:DGQHR domain-containing protein